MAELICGAVVLAVVIAVFDALAARRENRRNRT